MHSFVMWLFIFGMWGLIFWAIFQIRRVEKWVKSVAPVLQESQLWWNQFQAGLKKGYVSSALLCPIGDILPKSDTDESAVLLQTWSPGGRLVAGFRLDGVQSLYSDFDRLMRSNIATVNVLNNQAEDAAIQFRFEKVLRKGGIQFQVPEGVSEYDQWIMQNRVAHLNTRKIYDYRIYCYVSCKANLPNHSAAGIGFALRQFLTSKGWNRFPALLRGLFSINTLSCSLEDHRKAVAIFEEQASQFYADLRQICRVNRLTVEESARHVRKWLSTETEENHVIQRNTEVTTRSQLAESVILERSDYLEFADKLTAVISLDKGPEGTSPYMMRGLIGELSALDGEFALVLNLHYPAQNQTIANFEQQQKDAFLAVMAAPAQINEKAKKQYQELQELLKQAVKGAKIIQATMQLVAAVPIPETDSNRVNALKNLNQFVKSALASFRSMGTKPLRETTDLLVQYQRTLPGFIPEDSKDRDFTIVTLHAADLFPLELPYQGNDCRPVLACRNPQQALVSIDPRDSRLDNQGWLVTGGAGSGKSVTIGLLASALRFWEPKIPSIWVDKGASGEPYCRVTNGKYCSYDLSRKRVLNPFDHPAIRKGKLPPNKHMEAVTKFYSFILNLPGSIEGDLMRNLLHKAVSDAIESKLVLLETPRTQDLYIFLNSRKNDPEMGHYYRTMATTLESYIYDPFGKKRPGQYASLLDEPTHEDFLVESSFEYWDLDSIIQMELPRQIFEGISYLIAYRILQSGAEGTDYDGIGITREKNVFMDEIWQILKKNRILKDMLLELVKEGRKQGIAIFLSTQDVQDYLEGKNVQENEPESMTVLRNSVGRFLGVQQGDLTVLQNVLKLTQAEVDAVSSITESVGTHRLFLVKIGDKEDRTNLILIEPSPLDYWITTTHSEERKIRNNTVKRYMAAGHEINKAHRLAVWDLAKQYPIGVRNFKKNKIKEIVEHSISKVA